MRRPSVSGPGGSARNGTPLGRPNSSNLTTTNPRLNQRTTNPAPNEGNVTVNRNYGFLNGGFGYGYGGFGSRYGGYGYGNGYGSRHGYGVNRYGRGQLVPVYIPGFGWVYVPLRALRRRLF
jgi:hypothetical protein